MSKNNWQPVIGLEVHIELKTKSKMFCSCLNKHFREKPNTHVCPVCLGLPGALPVPNRKAIEQTITIASVLSCRINKNFWFDRKNYFYPDLPKGYQISQHFSPIGINGKVPILTGGKIKKIGISNIHLEEDTGKLIHEEKQTLIDFNRSGVPLVEIVSLPEITSAEEAKVYLKRLQQVVRWLGLSDCDMEKGSMRLEANISVTKDPKKLPDYKIEIKNLNSFRFVEKAINYEIERQIKILEKGKTPKQETRGFDSENGITFSQRGKEATQEYRYFPEPDIPPFKISSRQLRELQKTIEKMPWQTEKRIMEMEVKWQWAQIITQQKAIAQLFFETTKIAKSRSISPNEIANWIVNKKIDKKTKAVDLVKLVEKQMNRFKLSKAEIRIIAQQVISENPKAAEDYKKGKTQVIGFLIGQVQVKTKGKADPKLTQKILFEILNHKS